jgi:hypothetical protein
MLYQYILVLIRGDRIRSDSRNSSESKPDPTWILKKIKLIRPDLRPNDFQSNRNLSNIWKNTICKLTWSDPTLTRPDFFQKIKLTRFILPEPKLDPTRPIATSNFNPSANKKVLLVVLKKTSNITKNLILKRNISHTYNPW